MSFSRGIRLLVRSEVRISAKSINVKIPKQLGVWIRGLNGAEWLSLSWGFETTPSHSNGLKQLALHFSLFCSNTSLFGFLCWPCYGTKGRCEWQVADSINPTSFWVDGSCSFCLAAHLGEGNSDFKSPIAL